MKQVVFAATAALFLAVCGHAAAATVLVGDSSVESYADSRGTTSSEAFGYMAAQSGTASDAFVYLTSTTGVRVGVYADSRGKPGARLASASAASNTAGWVDLPLSARVNIAAGSRYWIALGANNATLGYRDKGSGGAGFDWSGAGVANPYRAFSEYHSDPASAYLAGAGETPGAPTAAFSYSPATPTVNQAISFDGSASTCAATPCTYAWTDGAGTATWATAPIASQSYPTAGTYTPTLTVTDAQGRTASVQHAVTVSAAPSGGPGSVVAASPSGPAAPSSGWHVAFADAFSGTLHDRTSGTVAGNDNLWLFNGGGGCRGGFNSDEVERFCPSQVSQQADGLHLTATYTPGVTPCADSSCNYTSSYVMTTGDTTPATGFAWMPNDGETWAFETVLKFAPSFDGGPQNSGNDEGWWAAGGPPLGSWKDEFDYMEHWGYNAVPSITGDVWVYSTSPLQSTDIHSTLSTFCGCDPSAAFHRYTTVINPDDSWAWYMDGRLIGTHAAPPSKPLSVWMKLILSYGLRVDSGNPNPVPGFNSGSRDFTIRSAAVYQDGAHAGKDVQNSAVAPGTTVG